MKDIAIGDVRVSRIEEMLGPAMAPQAFFREYSDAEFKEHEHWLAPNFYQAETGKLIASNHSWLLHTGRHVVLIDSCSGNHKPRPEMARYDMLNTSYLENLKAAGVQPEEIDFVLCTHLHVDHVGWNTRLENGRWVPTFRNAKHVMSRVEHDFWCAKARDPATQQTLKNVYNDSVLPVVENGMAVMFDNGYSLDDCLTIVPAPGHTPGHVRIDLRSKEQSAIFCGDVLHNPVQVPLWHWNTVFCDNPTQAKQSRHDVLSLCAESGALLMPMHFGQPHAARVKSKNSTFVVDFKYE
ncbi:MAG: MBL fold metallo-hydrolase [Pseudolabrys sp.]|nr:MBL fold metallo-hydrolase [Pseudolabrys sp.]